MRINRRTFLKGTIGTIATGTLFKPRLSYAINPKVISVYDVDCTTWLSGSWWGSDTYVNQARIDNMVSEGVKRLTGHSAELDAWTSLFPAVTGSTKVGIKVNENNLGDRNAIDWLPQLVNATIKGLRLRGFSEANIWIMDPSGSLPSGFRSIVTQHYPSVIFYNQYGGTGTIACTWSPGVTVDHTKGGLSDSILCDQISTVDYIIQMPIMKLHGAYQYTLTYKNLLGLKVRNTIQNLHVHLSDASNNCLVDLYSNTNIKDKTKLIIGDAIYGGRNNNYGAPAVWSIFGNAWPKRLFFSTDPVAIDSVMWDFINWQSPRSEHNAISNAAARGHGVHDHWNNPTEKKYSLIDFVQLDMGNLPPSDQQPPSSPQNLRIL